MWVTRARAVGVAIVVQAIVAASWAFPRTARAYGGDYVGPQDYLREHVRELDKALIFLDSNYPEGMMGWMMAYNDPLLQRSILLAWDRGHVNHDLAQAFPGYDTYRYTILFEGDLTDPDLVLKRFSPIDTQAELEAHLEEEEVGAPSS